MAPIELLGDVTISGFLPAPGILMELDSHVFS